MNDAFYNSPKWRRVSKVFLASRHYICERCGGAGEVAHHKKRLTRWNINNPDIALNMADLECLCVECHYSEHSGSSATAAGVSFDESGNVIYSPLFPPKIDT